jgi:hypothetical protein
MKLYLDISGMTSCSEYERKIEQKETDRKKGGKTIRMNE